jgi:hypothetical protein
MKWMIHFSLIVLGLALAPAPRAEEDQAAIDPQKRGPAVAAMVDALRAFQPTGEIRRVPVSINAASENRGAVYRVRGNGLVDTSTNGWVYLMLRSSHADPAVGDIILAIDNRGRVFETQGHVCGTVAHFVSAEKRAAEDPDDFFHRFQVDAADRPWAPLAE